MPHKIYITEKKSKEEHEFDFYDLETLKDSLEKAYNDPEVEVLFSVEESEISLENYIYLINLNPHNQSKFKVNDSNIKTSKDLTEWIKQGRILKEISKNASR